MAETVRARALLVFAFVALLGAMVAVPPAPATASAVKLEVNQDCVEPNWPCWTTETSVLYPNPAAKVTIIEGGEVEFVDHDPSTAASVNWIGGGGAPMCPGVPTTATLDWSGSCKFEQPGTYKFESSTMFKEKTIYTNIDYTKYEVVVEGTPKVTTMLGSPHSQTEATLTGSINPEGSAVKYYFEYERPGVTGSKRPTSPVTLNEADFTSHSVSLPVSELLPATEYRFELIVSYGAGKTVSGGPQTFMTPAATAPTVKTLGASSLKETGAKLNGTVDPEGGANAEYFFQWGAGAGSIYEHETPVPFGELPADGAEHAVSATLTGLAAGAEYHYRLVAKNSLGGPIDGEDVKFMTLSPPFKEPSKEPPAKEPTPTPTPTPTPIPGPISPEPELAPLVPALVQSSLKLTAPRHGSSVRGSVEVSGSGAGGRLEIDLIASSASLAKVRHKQSTSTVVGRLVRASVSAGKLSFSVSLGARAKSALRRHHRLALTVKITLTPTHGTTVTIVRSVSLRL